MESPSVWTMEGNFFGLRSFSIWRLTPFVPNEEHFRFTFFMSVCWWSLWQGQDGIRFDLFYLVSDCAFIKVGSTSRLSDAALASLRCFFFPSPDLSTTFFSFHLQNFHLLSRQHKLLLELDLAGVLVGLTLPISRRNTARKHCDIYIYIYISCHNCGNFIGRR